jgi:acyl-CoA synthetase (AMP-forming)/AMP-acid ligase II
MYRTGDLGRWLRDGTIEFLGRTDHRSRSAASACELGEIEARSWSTRSARGGSVGARGLSRARSGWWRTTPSDAEVEAESLRTHLVAALPEYMVPAAYVRAGALPLTPNGKLDRKALPAREGDAYVARAYEGAGAPRRGAGGDLAELLQVERVGRRDHFFELGGHSLLASR